MAEATALGCTLAAGWDVLVWNVRYIDALMCIHTHINIYIHRSSTHTWLRQRLLDALLLQDGLYVYGMRDAQMHIYTHIHIHTQVQRPHMAEATALGCALAAGLAVGVWKDVNALVEMHEKYVKYDKFQVQV